MCLIFVVGFDLKVWTKWFCESLEIDDGIWQQFFLKESGWAEKEKVVLVLSGKTVNRVNEFNGSKEYIRFEGLSWRVFDGFHFVKLID